MAVALMGDGSTERELLGPCAERVNGTHKTLLIPTSTIHWNKKDSSRDCGLSALQATKVYADRYDVAKSILIVDKEHVPKGNASFSLSETLRGYGIQDPDVADLGGQGFLANGTVGAHRIVVGIVISGKKKRIEENIAFLIYLEWKINVKPDKKSIRKVLHGKRCSLKDLMKNAKTENLNSAFPGLMNVLRRIEKE